MAERLDVWLGDELAGVMTRGAGGNGTRFKYSDDTVEAHLGRPVLSVGLPATTRPYGTRDCRPFFDGLLPEGEARRIVAFDAGIPESDTFGMLKEVGRECAGAVSIVAPGEHREAPPLVSAARSIEESEIAQRIVALPIAPLGLDGEVRLSLAGMQRKLLLTRNGQGWALPTAGSASTHLFKVANPLVPDLLVGEAYALRVARLAGLAAAQADLVELAGQTVLVVERYDRSVDASGTIIRRHQEDMCQALRVDVSVPSRKYEEYGGPSWRDVANVLRRWALPDELIALLQHLVVHALLGNADAHARNTSVFVGAERADVRLTPMYDVAPTFGVEGISATMGMFVNAVRSVRTVTLADVCREATGWGMDRDVVEVVVADVSESVAEASESLASDFDVPLVRAAAARVARLVTG